MCVCVYVCVVFFVLHMFGTVHNIKYNNFLIWYRSNNIDRWKLFYDSTVTHKINTKFIRLLNNIFSVCICIPLTFYVNSFAANVVSFWCLLFNISTPWETNNLSETFTFSNTKSKYPCMFTIGNSHFEWCLVIHVQKLLDHKTIWWVLKNMIYCYVYLYYCLTIIERSCQGWYWKIIGWSCCWCLFR